jgi:hypothetical protein
MDNVESNLKILNYLLASEGLATYSKLPSEGEKGCSTFNFIWGKSPREIQLLIVDSYLLHAKDFKAPATYEQPYLYLSLKVQNDVEFEVVKNEIDKLREQARLAKAQLFTQVQSNLEMLKSFFVGKRLSIENLLFGESNSPEAKEFRERLSNLKSLMGRLFVDACDKWIYPEQLVIPEDPVFPLYQDFLNFDADGKKKMYESWYKEFLGRKTFA